MWCEEVDISESSFDLARKMQPMNWGIENAAMELTNTNAKEMPSR